MSKVRINLRLGFVSIPIILIVLVLTASGVTAGIVVKKYKDKTVQKNQTTLATTDKSEANIDARLTQEIQPDENNSEPVLVDDSTEDQLVSSEPKRAMSDVGSENTKDVNEEQTQISKSVADDNTTSLVLQENKEPTSKVQAEDPCDEISCYEYQYCESGKCVNYCENTSQSCGVNSCTNCEDLDGCYEDAYRDYICGSGKSCIYNTDTCSDCSCDCGGYNMQESIQNNNCYDGKDNDCNEKIDTQDDGCIEGTEVGGMVTSDVVWGKTQSPFIVTSDVLVEAGVNLRIEPGVVVKFQKHETHQDFGGLVIKIKGSIDARGIADSKIVFTSFENNPDKADWGAIDLDNGASGHFDYVKFEYASYALHAPYPKEISVSNSHFANNANAMFVNGPATILNNIIENNNSGIIYANGTGQTSVTYNTIRNNTGQGLVNPYHAGLVFQDLISEESEKVFSYNNIYGNGVGIKFLRNPPSSMVIENNNIRDNGDYNVWLYIDSRGEEINLKNNWWGSIDKEVIASKIYDYYDNYAKDLSKVVYEPFWESGIVEAGAN